MKSLIFTVTMLTLLSLTPLAVHSMSQGTTDAKTLFEKKCSACHSADRPKSLKKTNEEWAKTVTRMKEKTANITNDEASMIIDYLAKTYGK